MTWSSSHPRALVLVPVATAVVLLSACGAGDGRGPVRISGVEGEAGSAVLRVQVDSCHQQPEVVAEETETQVRVTATVLQGNGDDCLDGPVTVTLDAPLGERAVVDGRSGEEATLSSPAR